MKFKPHQYQIEDAQFLEDHPQAALFLDLGLGKTSIVLMAIHNAMFSTFDTQRTLVVAPKNVALVAWPNELRKWDQFHAIRFTVLHGAEKAARLLTKQDLYIINYDGLQWLESMYRTPELRGHLPKFDMIVVDESTFIKNPTSRRSRSLSRLFGKAKRKVLLTGTPSPNGLLDLYGQFDFLAPEVLARTYESYKMAYFIPPAPGSPQRKYVLRGGVRDIITSKIAPYVRVRKESDVLVRDKAEHNQIVCALSPGQQAEYQALEREFFLQLGTGESIEVFNASSLSMKLRQYVQGFLYTPETGVPVPVNTVKAEALKELVEAMNGKPVLCAIQFQHEVEMLRKVFKYKVPALYSKTSSTEQALLLDQWNRQELPLLLAHPASGGIGLNLQDGGSTMVWFSATWDLQHYDQFNGRLDRQGQKERVRIHHITMVDTIDEVIVNALRSKATDQRQLVSSLREYWNGKKAS